MNNSPDLTPDTKVAIYKEAHRLIKEGEERYMCNAINHAIVNLYFKMPKGYDVKKHPNSWEDFYSYVHKRTGYDLYWNKLTTENVIHSSLPWFLNGTSRGNKTRRLNILNKLMKGESYEGKN